MRPDLKSFLRYALLIRLTLRLRVRGTTTLLIATAFGGCQPVPASSGADSFAERSAAGAREPSAAAARPGPGFRSERLFREHYDRHGREFGSISAEEYLRLARELRDAEPGGDVLEIVRGDGAISRFDRSTGSFLAYNRDLTIRTFFRPNDGEAYFRRQARRRPTP